MATTWRSWVRLGLRPEIASLAGYGGHNYALQTANGHYLTAVDGGGRTTDAIHSDATQVRAWEMFWIDCN